MTPDVNPERYADNMTAAQRIKQFEIRDPAPLSEIAVIFIVLLLLWLVIANAERIELWMVGVGL